jgi:hypothetical protein
VFQTNAPVVEPKSTKVTILLKDGFGRVEDILLGEERLRVELAICLYQRDKATYTKHPDEIKKMIIDRLTSGRAEDDQAIVATKSLYIGALVGTYTLLEDFKLLSQGVAPAVSMTLWMDRRRSEYIAPSAPEIDLLDSGTGASTVSKIYRLLRAVMNTAVDDEVVGRNPCRIKGAGVEPTPERPVIGVEAVLALADAVPERYRTFLGQLMSELDVQTLRYVRLLVLKLIRSNRHRSG